MKKYFVITYGCQMNISDSERIAAVLEKIGYKQASNENEADLIILNMCSVRQSAVNRVYGKIENFTKPKNILRRKKSKILLTGCILEKDIKKLKNKVDYILPIKSLKHWPEFFKEKKYFYYPNQRDLEFNKKFGIEYFKICSHSYCYVSRMKCFSAFVPISTGCDNFCSYCVVPYLRGPEISRPVEEIISEARNLIKKGYKEIWLLGQNVNSYKSEQINFARLLKLVNKIPGDFWIRFTSSHPKDFSDELIETMARCEKITPYLNLPVQSGDNEILKKMNRFYTVGRYKNLVEKIRKAFLKVRGKDILFCLTADIIVGFPGETKKQFKNTVKLFQEIKFDMAYISQYSLRFGTAAFDFKDNISQKEKKQRDKILTEVLKKTALKNNKRYVGREIKILVEKKKNEFLIGKSEQYKTVKIKMSRPHRYASPARSAAFAAGWLAKRCGRANLKFPTPKFIGSFVKVKITEAHIWGLKGIFIKN